MKKSRLLSSIVVFILVTSVFGIMFSGTAVAQEYSGDIWTTDGNGNTRDHLPEGSELYYTINLDESVSPSLTVDYYYDLDEPRIRRDDTVPVEDGEYEAHEDPLFFDPLELTDEFEEIILVLRDEEGEEIDQSTVQVYQPDLQHSTVITTEEDYETEKNNYFEDDEIYFRADMEDQHGWPPEEEPDIEVLVEKDGEEVETPPGRMNLDYDEDEGSFYGEFRLQEYAFGNYTLRIMDEDDELEYASTEFTVINLEISIMPEDDLYTQEQEIEIRVESNYEDNINVMIADDDDEPYEIMEGAMWEDEELINEFWSTEYPIPEDEEDGTYHVIVTSTEDDETLGTMEFDIQKYDLEVVTDKDEYVPGEEVNAFYTVSNLLDGSRYEEVDVEWTVQYLREDEEWDDFTGEAEDGEFVFTLPEDAATQNIFPPFDNPQFWITVSAIDAEERYHDEVQISRSVTDFDLDLDVESDEYFIGQTLYIDLTTSTGNVEVDVELHHDDEMVRQETVTTDSSGNYLLTMDLSGVDPGRYVVIGTAYWNEREDTDEDDFELLDRSKMLSVMLERDKGVNPYYPGEQGSVFYSVTHRGETVTDEVNVKYRLYSDNRILDNGFADGGEIDFTIPEDYNPSEEGWMEMNVEATLDRETYGESTIDIPIVVGDMILNPSSWEYEANDEVSFEYEFKGIDRDDIDSLEYRVVAEYEYVSEVIISGTPVDGTFEVTIPEDPATEHTVELHAVTEWGASIIDTVEISLISGFDLDTEIVTESDYTTGVFQPGDEIEIEYELISRDDRPLPEIIEFSYDIHGHPENYDFTTDETEGTVTLTIPDDFNEGEHMIFFDVSPRYSERRYENSEIIEIEEEPSMLDRRAFGSVSLGGLITVILILVALIIGGLAYNKATSDESSFDRSKDHGKKDKDEPEGKKKKSTEGEKETIKNFQIEEGEAEPEDGWNNGSQIEPEDR